MANTDFSKALTIIDSIANQSENKKLKKISKALNWVYIGKSCWDFFVPFFKKEENTDATPNSEWIVLRFSNTHATLWNCLLKWINTLEIQKSNDNGTEFDVCLIGTKLHTTPTKGNIDFIFQNTPGIITIDGNNNKKTEENHTLFQTRYSALTQYIKVSFNTRDDSVIDQFFDYLIENFLDICQETPKEFTPEVKIYQWGYWRTICETPGNRVAILPDGQYENILRDIQKFLLSEKWYKQVGIPWRRGYILEGIPGSGKTSTVIALASDLQMHVCIINLNNMTDDDLSSALQEAPRRGIILLEDADCAVTSKRESDSSSANDFLAKNQQVTQDNTNSKLTLSGFLNALDGVAAPDGRIMFMTTNYLEKIDPALLRPGRIDKKFHYTYATESQIYTLAKRFEISDSLATEYSKKWSQEQISMAEAQERLIQKHFYELSSN